MSRAVLDANVFVSALLHPEGPPGRIVEGFLRERSFELVLSPAIADEVLHACAYPKIRKHLREDLEPALWFEDLLVLADVIDVKSDVAGICEDPDDDKYLAAALDGRAGFLVTGDQRLLALDEYEGVRIVTPRYFLEILHSRKG